MLKLNTDSDESVNAFVREVYTRVDTLDVLVNNAGYMVTGVAEETPVEMGRQQFETNFWGTVRLTNALLPRFRAQKNGKIITVSSIVGLIGPPNLAYYTASKHAVQGYFKSLRFELEQFNISVSMVEPTWFKTDLAHNSALAHGNKISDYDLYRKKAAAATQKGIDEAEFESAILKSVKTA